MKKKPFIIGITGGTASGKTFVIESLKDRFNGKILVISQDQYYKDKDALKMDRWHRANMDAPEAFDNAILIGQIKKICRGITVKAPVYDYKSQHRLKEFVPMAPKPVIILEGILILYDPQVRDLIDYKIFLEADADIRLGRRILRDIEERGINIMRLKDEIEWYMNSVKPMYDKHIEPTKKYADLILNTNKGSLKAAEEIKKIIKKHLDG
jgi:uridine kinase